MKELIERLRNDCYQEDEVRAHAKEAADALERMEAERDALRADAERYRFIAGNDPRSRVDCPVMWNLGAHE
jgi:hypothetical protein